MLLDNGKSVSFGQHLHDAEKIFGIVPIQNPLPIAREGIDKQIRTEDVTLDFDHELLCHIEFRKDYQFENPLKLYAKAWKDFTAIDDQRIKPKMDREEFVVYLTAWEKRAAQLGASKANSADLAEDAYRISFTRDEFVDLIHIAMGPSRRAGGGGIWCDGWTAFFTIKTPAGKLKSISAFCDQFNTVARPQR